ncbi:TetR/AcrR family transcriptional regulator [Ktedonosporobacter rubrisoli]|uniref:TetR/AcrR family transcriptional regulator n=1 Tax=Ktedonosporobacter rubrisoli TaxID=2509675 RepID=A0A4P6JVU0_KTERU|nr:TetR/AcrR family transcriptional regulator [Ktedonosporobacter rubrisoli]QBD79482.1 TetR/AcrR family transcriptional regulator [Ktedonosporobacter rubrisoli]
MTQHREGRAAATRQRVLQIARGLYYAGGYDNVSLQAIADQLHISKPALFYHFKNKQELFYEMLLSVLEQLHEIFASASRQEALSTQQILRQIMLRLADEPSFDMARFMRQEYTLLSPEQQQQVGKAWRAKLLDIVHSILERGIARGELRPHNSLMASYMFLHVCLLLPQLGHQVHDSLREMQRNERIDTLLDLFIHGLYQAPT